MDKPPHFFLLASDPLVHLWPVSSNDRSFAFVRGSDGLSPVERLLRVIHTMRPQAPVTLITNERMLLDAKCALHESHISRYDIVLVDASTASGTLVTLAASLAKREQDCPKAVILPGTLLASSQKRLLNTVLQMVDLDVEDGDIIGVLANRCPDNKVGQFGTYFSASNSGRVDWTWIENPRPSGKKITSRKPTTGRSVELAGAVVAKPQSLLDAIAKTDPLAIQASANAIAMAKELSPGVLLPKCSFLSLVGGTRLDLALKTQLDKLRVLPLDEANVSTATDWSCRLAWELSATTSENQYVVATGYSNAQRIDFDGQTLLLNPGKEREVCFPSMQLENSPEAQPTLFAPLYKLLTTGYETEAWLLDLPGNTATERECHFTRTEKLTVLNGSISIGIENENFKLSAGQQANIAPGMAHTLQNHSSDTARILEMRIGRILDDDDRLQVPESDLYSSTAA
ncbi:MAG: hypothetical protein AAFY99_01355 [Pseudomonadota bacterium]